MDESRTPRRKRRWLLVGVGLALLVVVIVAAARWGDESVWQERQQLAEQVLAGTLKPDAAGVVILPSESRGLTAHGKLYVTRKPDGCVQILFTIWQGKGSNFEGYLFDRPGTFYDWESGPTVAIVGPHILPAVRSVTLEADVEAEVRPGWYRVSYRMD